MGWAQSELTWYAIAVAFIVIIATLCGCASHSADEGIFSPIPQTASSVDRASAHVSSADALVTQAKPSADKTGQALLNAAGGEHSKAQAALSEAKTDLASAAAEKAALQKAADTAKASEAKVRSGWGYKTQVIVARIFYWLVALVALHFVLLALGLCLPPPWSLVCSVLGKVINPLGWLVAIADHLHCNCQKTEPASLTPTPPIDGSFVAAVKAAIRS